MDRVCEGVARRELLVTGAFGAAAAGLAAPAAAAAEPTAAEAANVKMVADFFGSFTDLEKPKNFLAPDCSVRFDEKQTPIIGHAAFDAALKAGIGAGKASVTVLSASAKGPIVMNERVDTITVPGKPAQVFKVVDALLIRDGKIKEWTDYQNG